MRRQPIPGRLDNQTQVLELRLPAQFALDPVGAGDEHGGISGSTRRYPRLDLAPGNFTGGVDHFLDGVAVTAAAEVIDRAALVENVQGENVRARQIDDVNVIAHAGAVA